MRDFLSARNKEGGRLTYASAGVDIDAANKAKELIKKQARIASRPEVLSDIGLFGGLFELQGYSQPVLVSSADGVGTKLKVASALGRYDTIGVDLVNHCVNDILTCGADPLFLLDYIATAKLVPEQVESVVQGIAQACSRVGCALLGGETAEMPGLYFPGDFDLVGFIVGVVEKKGIIDGKSISIGDAILGLPSSGLHTNGYSLARQVFKLESPAPLETYYPELGRTLGEELLEPHRSYYSQLKPLLPLVKGIAHITGGGLVGNAPRILPPGVAAQFHQRAWPVPAIFRLIQQQGNIDKEEMYRVFNMGIGMVIICSADNGSKLVAAMPEALAIGEIVAQRTEEQVNIA